MENGFKIKCPTCEQMMFVPMDEFNGNFGNITGKCPKCLRFANVMIVVCDKEKLDEEVSDGNS